MQTSARGRRRSAAPVVAALVAAVLQGCTCSATPPLRDRGGDATHPTGDTATAPGPTGATGDTAGEPLAWVSIDAGFIDSCGVLTDGRVVCWGNDEYVALAPTGSSYVEVSLGTHGGCARTFDGAVECWCGDVTDASRVCDQQPRDAGYVEVQDGTWWACAQDAEGRLHCWGGVPRPGAPPSDPVLHWSIDEGVGCAVLADGTLSCWGHTVNWEGWSDTAAEPVTGPPPELKYTQVAVGRTHACALDTEGEAHCWGVTGLGVPYPAAPPGPFASITAWNQITCGLRPDATAECWYDFPQLWDVDDEPPEANGGPKWEPPPGERWATIGLGEWAACGLTVAGEARCWMEQMEYEGVVSELPALSDL